MPNKIVDNLSMAKTANSCVLSPAIVVDPVCYGASKKNRDRENIGYLIPLLHAGDAKGEEAVNKRHIYSLDSKSPTNSFATISIMYGTSKSKKCYSNSINRKKQNQQQVLNSLKSWNVKIASSGLDKPEAEFAVGKSHCGVPEKHPYLQNNELNGLLKEGNIRSNVASSNEQRKQGSDTESKITERKKKPSHEADTNKFNQPKLSVQKQTSNVYAEDVADEKHLDGSTGLASLGFISGDNDHSHVHSTDSKDDRSTGSPLASTHSTEITLPSTSPSSYVESFASKGYHQRNHVLIGKGAANCWGWNKRDLTNTVSKEVIGCRNTALNGQLIEQTSEHMERMTGKENRKQKESNRTGHRIAENQSFSHRESVIIHSNSQHQHQQMSYTHQLGKQYHEDTDQFHSAQQSSEGTMHQYSVDFIRDVGQKLSVVGGGTSLSPMNSMLRTSYQMNYNLTTQVQEQMMHPHYHNNHLHHQHHRQIVPQQHHQRYIQRSYNTYVGEDLLCSPSCAGGVMNEPKSFLNYAVIGAGDIQNATKSPQNVEPSSYGYNQNGLNQNGQQQQQQGLHYHTHISHNHHQQQQVHNHGYHQNNNYQQYNRNANGIRCNQMNYMLHGGGEATSREDSGKNGKKSPWDGNSGKHSNKVQTIGYGYRKTYQHNHNNHTGGGHGPYYDASMSQQHQQHQKQQHLHRNLVYVRGYEREQSAVLPHEYHRDTDGGIGITQQETERTRNAYSVPSSPKSKNVLKMDISSVFGHGNEPDAPVDSTLETEEEEEEACVEDKEHPGGKLEKKELSEVDECGLKDLCSVPRSSSSSSMVSIPSTESSAISPIISQRQLQGRNHASGNEYDSDSSHSSDFRDATYRSSTFEQLNSGQVYRSSSSTSGISSSATTPHSNDIPSTPSSLHASTVGLSELIIRSHSYHGSHQNLATYGSVRNVRETSSPIGSPTGALRPVSGTQSVPVFGDLFCNSSHNNSAFSFGSSSSLELALRSSSSSLSVSSVPPNEFQSMQSGHPKKRSQSGRTSPIISNGQNRNTGFHSGQTKRQSSSGNNSGWKDNQVSLSYLNRSSLPADFQYTPADRFILLANEIEVKTPPMSLTNGTIWDKLSYTIWKKFCVAQQTADKYLQKMQLWRELYIFIKHGFPKCGLYLVGSTISGFGADSSDVDMCLVSRPGPGYFDPRNEALQNLTLVKNYFMGMATSSFDQFCLIQAKVPILRFQDSKNGIEVDLNYNNCVGIRNTHLLHCYSQMDWRVRPLVLIVKLWARHHNINDAKNMTISSYSLVLMVIHFLQYGVNPPVLPCLHSLYPEKFMKFIDINNIEMIEQIEPYQTDNKQTLGELLLQFLEYYKDFDYAHRAISVRTASTIPIEECRLSKSYKNDLHQWKHLCIEEPFDLTNTARSVFDGEVFEQIKCTISTSWRMLKDSNELSVLFGEPLFMPVTSTLSITS